MNYVAILADRSVISLTGPDSRNLLQGLVSSDMAECVGGKALYAALLTPQGKILFEFFIVEGGPDRLLIDCASERAADLIKRLSMYKLRAKVVIAPAPELAVAAAWNSEAPEVAEIIFVDPRLPALGYRLIDTPAALEKIVAANSHGDYRAHLLAQGVPASVDLPPDTVFALDAGLEELHGVNFKKGCYVGQEVTSRMKLRATARRRFVLAEGDGALPPSGTPLEAGGREIGTLASGVGPRALALVRLDRLAEAENTGDVITAAGRPVTLRKPGWFHG